MAAWRVSPYPRAFDWAFTIVHDADDAYSRRLAPLFEVFDRYQIKVSMTAFAFWADWAEQGGIWSRWKNGDSFYAPKAVPLEVPSEREFYKSLVARGHEVGLHTASDSHATRDETRRAFELFRREFGNYPPIYVEHRDNRQNLQIEGADPASPYFTTDLLNEYRPYVWIVSPSAIPYAGRGRYYDVLSSQRPLLGYPLARRWGEFKEFIKTRRFDQANGRLYELLRRGGSPFDRYAREKYGLCKGFRRAGRRQDADGTGFVEWFQDRHLDDLERRGGLAITYTHLNTKWLEPGAPRMRADIAERIREIASRNVWLATASAILDRFALIEHVHQVVQDNYLLLVNGNDTTVTDLTVIAPPEARLLREGRCLMPRPNGHIVVGDIRPRETLVFKITDASIDSFAELSHEAQSDHHWRHEIGHDQPAQLPAKPPRGEYVGTEGTELL